MKLLHREREEGRCIFELQLSCVNPYNIHIPCSIVESEKGVESPNLVFVGFPKHMHAVEKVNLNFFQEFQGSCLIDLELFKVYVKIT